MTTDLKIRYLQLASVACYVVSFGYFQFGFPYWFLNAVDKPEGHFVPPIFIVNDNPYWIVGLTGIAMFVISYSLWKTGEPTGFGESTKFLFVLMAGAISVFLNTWVAIPFAPLGAFLNAVGMILIGIASLKSRLWSGWRRYTPLFIGGYPFLFMYPLLALTGQRPSPMVGLWFIPWLLLGVAIWQRSKTLTTHPTK